MTQVLLDTHTWIWSLTEDDRLSDMAAAAIEQAETIFISPISIYEIGQKVRIGRWPEAAPFLDQLVSLVDQSGGRVAEISPETSLLAATLDWFHRDPFDRILAATAIGNRLDLISADSIFDTLEQQKWSGRVW